MKTSWCVLLLIGWAGPLWAVDYLEEIKPLLEHKCYACHGALKQQGSLRLDTAASARKGGDSGAAVTPGDSANSLLIDAVTGAAGFRMPPANEGAPLTDEEIDLLRRWIDDGAKAPADEQPQTDPRQWWSYQPLQRPAPPRLEAPDRAWARSEIDNFIAAKRHHQRLPHVPPADKSTWLRRVYLDLIGLPPTRAQRHQFLRDESPSACERVVDELLSRPEYGERWGRHWMDIWRYSDWYGSRGINEIRYSQRHIWRWRDWIVRSLNDDIGYDQMVREMLAGDEIARQSETLAATGYLGRSWYKFDRNVWMFETVERTGEAFLGLTLRCCRCHDHKFDPVTHEEYYRFRAFFEPHDVRTDPLSALTGTQKDSTLGQVPLDGISLVYDKHPDATTYRFERGDNRYPDKSQALAPGVPAALGGILDVQPVELPVTTWYPALRQTYRESLRVKSRQQLADAEAQLVKAKKSKSETEARLASSAPSGEPPTEFLTEDFAQQNNDVWQIVNGDWKFEDGLLRQTSVTSFATIVSKQNHPSDFRVTLRYRALTAGTYRSIGFSFDYQDKGNSQDVYTSTGDSRQSVQAFHRLGGKQVYPQAGIVPVKLAVGDEVTLTATVTGARLSIDLNGKRKLDYTMPAPRREGRFALWVHQGAAEFLRLEITELGESEETLKERLAQATREVELAEMELVLSRRRSESLKARLAADVARYLGRDDDQFRSLAKVAAVAEAQCDVQQAKWQLRKATTDKEKAAAATSLAEAEATWAELQSAKNDGPRQYTAVGEQYPQTSTGRRSALADWITDDTNVRTARVAANHIWGRHFGRPLVATPENFGLNGRKPTHPLLLDWLASELVANHWKMKPLHRQIVLSATYRMSSRPLLAEDELELATRLDGKSEYFWRMPSRRMEAEVVRDSALHLANRLNRTMGGPELSEKEAEKTLRRSLYFRNTPNEKVPMLEIFDIADPNACYRRKESVVPHQSLALMNSQLALDCADSIATQLSHDEDFIGGAFETILQRSPTGQERVRCEAFLDEHMKLVSQPLSKFAGAGQRPAIADPMARARRNLVHTLLWHNDFVTIR